MLVVAVVGGFLFVPGGLACFVLTETRWSRRYFPHASLLTAVGSALLAVSVPFVSGDPLPLRVLQGVGLGALAGVLVAAPRLLREYEEVLMEIAGQATDARAFAAQIGADPTAVASENGSSR